MNRFSRSPWDRSETYFARRRVKKVRGTVIAVIGGAMAVGVGAGYLLERNSGTVSTKPDAPIEWNQVQAARVRIPDAQDIAWENRSRELDDGSRAQAPAVQASFGYCYSGGGTNCVVDGDTFYLNGEKVRIADIDAPEIHPARCEYEARLGNEATRKLHDLLNNGAVTMTSIDRDRDVYGRLLRNVQVDGADVGETMISAGVAREYGSGRRPWC